MAYNNVVSVTLKIRNDLAANWTNNNPILAQGEFGLENNSFLFKVGDGVTPWNSLKYLNKLDPQYLVQKADGTISFSESFYNILQKIVTTDGGQTITGPTYIDYGTDALGHPNPPTENLAIATKYYVDNKAAAANTTYSFASGDNDGEIKIIPSTGGTAGAPVSVKPKNLHKIATGGSIYDIEEGSNTIATGNTKYLILDCGTAEILIN